MAAPEILTFGCRLNAFESEVIRGHALAAGLEDAVIATVRIGLPKADIEVVPALGAAWGC